MRSSFLPCRNIKGKYGNTWLCNNRACGMKVVLDDDFSFCEVGGGGGKGRVRFHLSHKKNFLTPPSLIRYFSTLPPHPRQICDKKVDDPLRS